MGQQQQQQQSQPVHPGQQALHQAVHQSAGGVMNQQRSPNPNQNRNRNFIENSNGQGRSPTPVSISKIFDGIFFSMIKKQFKTKFRKSRARLQM